MLALKSGRPFFGAVPRRWTLTAPHPTATTTTTAFAAPDPRTVVDSFLHLSKTPVRTTVRTAWPAEGTTVRHRPALRHESNCQWQCLSRLRATFMYPCCVHVVSQCRVSCESSRWRSLSLRRYSRKPGLFVIFFRDDGLTYASRHHSPLERPWPWAFLVSKRQQPEQEQPGEKNV